MFSQSKRKGKSRTKSPEEEVALIRRIYQTFTPGTPIDDPDMFAARRNEVMRLHNFVQTPGEVAFIFGERGVGKTSLAKHTAAKFSKEFGWKPPLFKSCDPNDEFAALVAHPLGEVGVDVSVEAECTEQQDDRSVSVNLGPIRGKLGGDQRDVEMRRGSAAQANQPSWSADRLVGLQRILVIDELDILENTETKKKLAVFIKHLSDRKSRFRIIITGIAQSMEDLLSGHTSNLRCVKEVKLRRMSNEDIAALIRLGEERLGIEFAADALLNAVEISEGYPSSAHLIAREATIFAVQRGSVEVTTADIISAIRAAYQDADEHLKKKYEKSVQKARAEDYKHVLMAISHCRDDQIKARDIISSYKRHVNGDASDAQVRAFVSNLAAEDNSRLLQRTGPGIYRFTDPRLPGFIRLAQSFDRAHRLEENAGA